MSKVILFGGTAEGRFLHELLKTRKIPALTCVATEYGKDLLGEDTGTIMGRMDYEDMRVLFSKETPIFVLDATHPYAGLVSGNIKAACDVAGIEYLRISRESASIDGGFKTLDELIEKLNETSGAVFSALGVKEAKAFTRLPEYKKRVWLRLLPSVDGIKTCLELGYPAKHLICMQGPFSKELNIAMFKSANAKILVTKESGPEGGFMEKLDAAKELDMPVFILKRPEDTQGVSLESAVERIESL